MRFFRIYGLSILSSLGVLYLSILRDVSPLHLPKIPYFDKVAHCGLYLVLSAVICFELYRQRYTFSDKIMWAFGLCFPILYGGLMELLQEYYFPPRTGDWSDWIADIIGVFVAFFLCKKLLPKYVKPENQGISCR